MITVANIRVRLIFWGHAATACILFPRLVCLGTSARTTVKGQQLCHWAICPPFFDEVTSIRVSLIFWDMSQRRVPCSSTCVPLDQCENDSVATVWVTTVSLGDIPGPALPFSPGSIGRHVVVGRKLLQRVWAYFTFQHFLSL